MVGIRHPIQGSGTNDPNKQVSVTAWQGDHSPGNCADVLTDHTLALHQALIDVMLMKRAPAGDITVTAGYSAVIVGDYEIATGQMLELAADGVMEIT